MQKFSTKSFLSLILFLLLLLISYLYYTKSSITPVGYDRYNELLEKRMIDSAKVVGQEVILETKDHHHYSMIIDGVDFKQLLEVAPVKVADDYDNYLIYLFAILLFLLTFIITSQLLQRYLETKNSLSTKERDPKRDLEHSYAYEGEFQKRVLPVKSEVTFDDVAGIESVEDELKEIVDFLKEPKKYLDFGIKLPKGVLLVGPPGVGKTLIAKAVAGEAGVPFFYQSAASFVHIYVGMGAKRVSELFQSAKRNAPSIIFIDEIDAVGKSRGGYGQNDEREATLNQLLTEMDGFEDSSNVVVIAATNKIESLDSALLRAGRFDRRVYIVLPNIEQRAKILDVHLKEKPHQVDSRKLAEITVGFSGAALATLVNEAAIHALKIGKKRIELEDFLAVKDKVLFGKRLKKSYSKSEKEILALYHGAKALSAYWYGVDFDRVGLLEMRLNDAKEEIASKSDMLNRLKVYLSGMVATKLNYDDLFSIAKGDIKEAKSLALKMVDEYGMGDDLFGSTIDSQSLLEHAMEDVREFLERSKQALNRISEILIVREIASKEEIKEVCDELL